MNIDIVAARLRGYPCAECFRATQANTNGYHLKVARVNVVVAGIKVGEKSVDEDLHRACGDALRDRINASHDRLASGDAKPTQRLCVHCGLPVRSTCATCGAAYHFDKSSPGCAAAHEIACST